ncbi:MAG: hypothetical protein ACFFB0_08545 [Promethearchaeota archaeon]
MRTHNYKKLAWVGIILTNNKLNEFGIKLGMRACNKNKHETLFEYMRMINEVFLKNLKIQIFPDDLLYSIQECEQVFLKSQGNVPLDYIKTIFANYFELLKLDIPNLHETLQVEDLTITTPGNLFSFLSSMAQKKRKNDDLLHPLLLQKIQQQETQLLKGNTRRLDANTLKTAIHLKTMKDTLTNHKSRKIIVEGTLKDNISYQRSQTHMFSYFVFGVGLLFFMFSLLMLLQMIMQPSTIGVFGLLGPICFVPCILLYILYKKNSRTTEDINHD